MTAPSQWRPQHSTTTLIRIAIGASIALISWIAGAVTFLGLALLAWRKAQRNY